LKNLSDKLRKLFLRFFGPVPGAIKDHLNSAELLRISVAALMAGGGILGILQAILAGVGTIFPAPNDAAAAAFVLTFLLECVRRLSQGHDLTSGSRWLRMPPGQNGNGSGYSA
jgi:hypothetical protein